MDVKKTADKTKMEKKKLWDGEETEMFSIHTIKNHHHITKDKIHKYTRPVTPDYN